MTSDEQKNAGFQIEIDPFNDLSQFDELERKVIAVVQRLEEMRAENSELRDRIRALENEIRQKNQENEDLLTQRDVKRETIIRQRLQELLRKLEGF